MINSSDRTKDAHKNQVLLRKCQPQLFGNRALWLKEKDFLKQV